MTKKVKIEDMKALIIVDLQNDFMPGGSLPVPDGDKIIPIINQILPDFDLVIFTQDWHSANSKGFASQHKGFKPFDKYVNKKGNEDILWPDHCIAGTPGADFHKDIDYGKCKKNFYIFRKGLNKNSQGYSGFEDTKLAEFLRSRKVDEVVVCGLAFEFCCMKTALDSFYLGFETSFILDAVKHISEEGKNKALDELIKTGIKIIKSSDLTQ